MERNSDKFRPSTNRTAVIDCCLQFLPKCHLSEMIDLLVTLHSNASQGAKQSCKRRLSKQQKYAKSQK